MMIIDSKYRYSQLNVRKLIISFPALKNKRIKRQFFFIIGEQLIALSIGLVLLFTWARPLFMVHERLNSHQWINAVERFKEKENHPGEIIFAGNSLTALFDLSVFGNENVLNRGIKGDFTEGLLNRLDEIVDSKPISIFIEIGINDILANVSDVEIVENYKQIIVYISIYSDGTEICCQSLLPVNLTNTFFISNECANQRIVKINSLLRGICIENNAKYIDLHRRFVMNGSLNPDYTYDGVHLTEKGYKAWKEMVVKYVNE